jgi:hypothetical protein
MHMLRQLAIAAVAVTLTASAALAQGANFSGTWEIDAAKSNFGPMQGPNGPPKITMVVDHKDPVITVKTTRETPNGSRTSEAKYTTDGKESINSVTGMGGQTNDVPSTMAWKSKSLSLDSKMNMRGQSMQQHQDWTLSADGKTLTIEVKIQAPMGEIAQTQVFNKVG